ncbi:MAG: hypothetical protein DI539_03275 [Flavobacterium psychrophilum]|nr:MAG: hypothetical protein DI539_03275 [Flavobacterium psychrophilum]
MKTLIATTLLLLMLVSCKSNDSNIKYSYSFDSDGTIKREMQVRNSINDIEITMEGNAAFNTEETLITGLTPGGNINYRNKKSKLNAVPSKDGVTISLEQNGKQVSNTSDSGKEIIKEAIIHIKKLQQKHK